MTRHVSPSAVGGSALVRALAFLLLWIVLFGPDARDLAIGLATAVAASWVSLRLLPPGATRPRPAALARLALRFLRQSVVAGIDVARRAFDPRLPLQPGFVALPLGLPPGPARQAFRLLSSLQPGTLPVGPDEDGELQVHCLDVTQPVASQMGEEERLFARALGREAAP